MPLARLVNNKRKNKQIPVVVVTQTHAHTHQNYVPNRLDAFCSAPPALRAHFSFQPPDRFQYQKGEEKKKAQNKSKSNKGDSTVSQPCFRPHVAPGDKHGGRKSTKCGGGEWCRPGVQVPPKLDQGRDGANAHDIFPASIPRLSPIPTREENQQEKTWRAALRIVGWYVVVAAAFAACLLFISLSINVSHITMQEAQHPLLSPSPSISILPDGPLPPAAGAPEP